MAGTSKASGRGAVVLLTLFGLPFLGIGVFMGYRTGAMLWRWSEAKGWEDVPAVIEHVELETHHGDDSTTYEVVCRYRYRFSGEEHTGEEVGLVPGADNLGSWHERTHARLRAAYERGEAVTCYVDPGRPGRALLDRELRWGLMGFHLIFVVCFGGVGAGLIAGGAYARRSAARKAALQEAHGGEPWLWNPQWASRRIRSGSKTAAIATTGFAAFWNAISAPVAFILPGKAMDEGEPWLFVFMVFPLIGLVLAIAAARAVARYRKFGRSTFELETLPGVIGGELRGTVVLAGKVQGISAVDAALKCVHSVTTGSGKNRSTRQDVVWEETRRFEALGVRFGEVAIRLPVAFQIPYSCRPTNDSLPNSTIKWNIEVKGEAPGVDLAVDFEVPVFKTEASDPEVGPSAESVAEAAGDEAEESRGVRSVGFEGDTN